MGTKPRVSSPKVWRGRCGLAPWLSPLLILPASLAASPAAAADSLTTVRVASGLVRPVYVTAPAGDPRLFLVEQRGTVRVLSGGAVKPEFFLDIDSLVAGWETGPERGLMGLAFHPGYAGNGRFFVHYTNLNGHTTVAEYGVSGNPDRADHSSARIVLTVHQPFVNHNGGQLEFGPLDGYLYLALGDGGGGGDPLGRAQDLDSLQGKILRVDVDGAPPYEIPSTNPFVGVPDAAPEIWAYGFRNPYRTCFDRVTGDLWIGDVGEDLWEEVSFEPGGSPGGLNYGWDKLEGLHCYPPASVCNPDTFALPIVEYGHVGGRCSVTGGRVYRGSEIPWLVGTYFWGDWCTGQSWTLRYDGSTVSDSTERTFELDPLEAGLSIQHVSAFGEDGFGELYVVDYGTGIDGEVYRVVDRSAVDVEPGVPPSALAVRNVAPNPFREAARFEVFLPSGGDLEVAIYDATGRRVRLLERGFLPAGARPFVWDGRSDGGLEVAPGVYLVRARLGSSAATYKLERVR